MSRPRWKRIWITGFSRLRPESQSLISAIEPGYEVDATEAAGTMDRSSADPGGLGDFFAVWHAAGRAAPRADDRAAVMGRLGVRDRRQYANLQRQLDFRYRGQRHPGDGRLRHSHRACGVAGRGHRLGGAGPGPHRAGLTGFCADTPEAGGGYVLWDSYYFLGYDLVLAAMASIGLLGYLSDLAIRALMARVLHWQRNTTIQGGEG